MFRKCPNNRDSGCLQTSHCCQGRICLGYFIPYAHREWHYYQEKSGDEDPSSHTSCLAWFLLSQRRCWLKEFSFILHFVSSGFQRVAGGSSLRERLPVALCRWHSHCVLLGVLLDSGQRAMQHHTFQEPQKHHQVTGWRPLSWWRLERTGDTGLLSGKD